MPVADRTALIAALSTHRSHELLGTPESTWLDFKLSPWHLANDRGKWELAKDVAAMAKGGGGLLVVGVETTRQAHDTHDTATRLSPFDQANVNIDAIKGVLKGWIVPPHRPEMHWFESAPATGKFFLVLDVAALLEREGHAVVRRSITDDGKTVEAMAIPVRVGDETEWLRAEQVQQLLRDGLNSRALAFAASSRPAAADVEQVRERARTALEDLEATQGWGDEPVLYWQSYVAPQPATLPGLYAPDGIRGYLDDPGKSLRPQGFRFHNPYRQTNVVADGLSLGSTRGLALSVRSDAITTAGVIANRSLLARSNGTGPDLPVSSIVLTELTYEFLRLVDEQVLPRVDGLWLHRLVIRRFEQNHVTLSPGEPRAIWAHENKPAKTNGLDQEFEASGDSALDAGTALSIFYGMFGLDLSANPFVTGGKVDVEKFLSKVSTS